MKNISKISQIIWDEEQIYLDNINLQLNKEYLFDVIYKNIHGLDYILMFNVIIKSIFNNRVELEISIVKQFYRKIIFREFIKFNFIWYFNDHYDTTDISIYNPKIIINKDKNIKQYIEILKRNMFLSSLSNLNNEN